MKSIKVDNKGLDTLDKDLINKASDEFDRGDYHNAYNHFLSVYNNGREIQGIQLNIALCLLKLNKKRQARLFLFRESLDFPKDTLAFKLLSDQRAKVNGKLIQKTFTQTKRPDKYPDISLVLIVKNEEKDLPRCLDSFKDIVKEIVIVDTGSTDRTVEIAKSYGARVEYFEWCDDFSAARNESLRYASCEWILRTDADEYIEDSEKAKLLHCINSGLAEVYICPTISFTENGNLIVENVRLIKNHLGIKYDYPIHETVVPSLVRLGFTQCVTNVDFWHTGYKLDEQKTLNLKIKRNINICTKYLESHPDNYYIRLIKNCLEIQGDQNEKSINDMEVVIQKLPDNVLPVKYLGIAYLLLAQKYIFEKKEIELISILMDMQIDFNSMISMMQFVGEVYLFTFGDIKKAKKMFARNLQLKSENLDLADLLSPQDYNLGKCCSLLAENFVLEKDYQNSRKYFSQAKKYQEMKEFENAMNSEKNDDPISEFNLDKLNPDELRALAKSYKEKSQWLTAYHCTIRAASKSEINFQDYLDLAYYQIELTKTKFAQVLLNEAQFLMPHAASIINLESLIALRENNNEKALEKAIESFVIEPTSIIYQNNVEQIARLLGVTPVQAIRKVGMNWINQKKIKNGMFALILYLKFQPDDIEIIGIINKYSKEF